MLLQPPTNFQPNELVVIEFASSQPKVTTVDTEDKKETPLVKSTLEELIQQEWLPDPTYLQARNPHPYDWRVKFYAKDHVYSVAYSDNCADFSTEFNCSVSEFVHKFFPPFDPKERIQNMKRGRNWNTEKSPYRGMSDDDILKSWEHASTQGTFYHSLFENHCNGYDLANSKYNHLVPVKQYLKWRQEFFDKHFVEFRTEFRMHSSSDLRLVGTADLIAIRKDHGTPEETGGILTISIFDWKNTKNLSMYDSRGTCGYGPCSKMSHCNYSHYCLQQNAYAYLFMHFYNNWTYNGRKYTRVQVEMMKLVVLHDNNINNEANMVDIPDYFFILEQMIDIRRKEVQEFIQKQKSKEVELKDQ